MRDARMRQRACCRGRVARSCRCISARRRATQDKLPASSSKSWAKNPVSLYCVNRCCMANLLTAAAGRAHGSVLLICKLRNDSTAVEQLEQRHEHVLNQCLAAGQGNLILIHVIPNVAQAIQIIATGPSDGMDCKNIACMQAALFLLRSINASILASSRC